MEALLKLVFVVVVLMLAWFVGMVAANVTGDPGWFGWGLALAAGIGFIFYWLAALMEPEREE